MKAICVKQSAVLKSTTYQRVSLSRPGAGPCNRMPVRVNAAKAAAVVAETFQSTGVPMVDELLAMATIKDAAVSTVKIGLIAMVAVAAGAVILDYINDKLPSDTPKFSIVTAGIKAACGPSSTLLPFYGAAYGATLASAFTQVCAIKMGNNFNALFNGRGKDVLAAIKAITQLMQDATEVLLVVGVTWTLVRFKDYLAEHLCNVTGGKEGASARLIIPVSGALTWVIYAGGVFSALAAAGINIQPLLASVGGAGVVIGLATQKFMTNVASAVALYTSPPFSVGDEVTFVEPAIDGTILSIQPMNTIVKMADGSTLIAQNSKVVEWMVINKTKKA